MITEVIDKIRETLIPGSFEKDEIGLEDSDQVLKGKLDLRIDEARAIQRPRLLDWNKNLRFFDGDHWQVSGILLPTYKSDIFINKVFSAFRSLVAYETDSKPEPVVNANVLPTTQPETSDALISISRRIENMLVYKWDLRQVPITLTEIYYDRYIFNDGYGMYFWNAVDDDVDFEIIKPQELLRSPGSTCIDDAEYIIIEKWRNKKYFLDNYPDLVDKIKFTDNTDVDFNIYPTNQQLEKSLRNNLAKVHYYFQDDIWIFKCGEVILEKSKNKHWEWRSEDEQTAELQEKFGAMPENWQPIKNHFKKPKKPIIHFKGYHLGGEFESRSLMKQIIKLNELINKRKCQIQDIIDGTGVPQWVIDPSVPQDQVEKITSKPGLKIRIKPDLVRKEPAMTYPQGTLEDLIHTERKFDDIVGIHEVSMGAATKKRVTKGEIELLKESDIVPIRLLMRNSEAAMIELINGWVQLMKLFYDQPHYIGQLGNVAATNYGEFLTREEIPDNLSVLIKVGSTLPVSKEMRREQYVRDFQLGAISLQDYLRLMEYPNPEKLYQNIIVQRSQQMQQQPTQ